MAGSRLKDFYHSIAFGEFDKALEMIERDGGFDDEPEKIVIQALKLKGILRKNYLPG